MISDALMIVIGVLIGVVVILIVADFCDRRNSYWRSLGETCMQIKIDLDSNQDELDRIIQKLDDMCDLQNDMSDGSIEIRNEVINIQRTLSGMKDLDKRAESLSAAVVLLTNEVKELKEKASGMRVMATTVDRDTAEWVSNLVQNEGKPVLDWARAFTDYVDSSKPAQFADSAYDNDEDEEDDDDQPTS